MIENCSGSAKDAIEKPWRVLIRLKVGASQIDRVMSYGRPMYSGDAASATGADGRCDLRPGLRYGEPSEARGGLKEM